MTQQVNPTTALHGLTLYCSIEGFLIYLLINQIADVSCSSPAKTWGLISYFPATEQAKRALEESQEPERIRVPVMHRTSQHLEQKSPLKLRAHDGTPSGLKDNSNKQQAISLIDSVPFNQIKTWESYLKCRIMLGKTAPWENPSIPHYKTSKQTVTQSRPVTKMSPTPLFQTFKTFLVNSHQTNSRNFPTNFQQFQYSESAATADVAN